MREREGETQTERGGKRGRWGWERQRKDQKEREEEARVTEGKDSQVIDDRLNKAIMYENTKTKSQIPVNYISTWSLQSQDFCLVHVIMPL